VHLPDRVSAELLESWRRLADAVATELRAAGLTVARLDNGAPVQQGPTRGALVDVDPFHDGGVFVSWQSADEIEIAAMAAVEAGHVDDPAIQRSGGISHTMIHAMAALLTAAGFTVANTKSSDFRPLQIHVSRNTATQEGEV